MEPRPHEPCGASSTGPPDGDLPLAVRRRLHHRALFALPVIAIVPVVIAMVLARTLAPTRAGAAALGAAGWLVSGAARVRGRVGLLPDAQAGRANIDPPGLDLRPGRGAHPPAAGAGWVHGFGSLLWAGFGLGAIEVVSTLVTAVGVRRLLLEPSDKAAQARRGLVSMGWLQYVQSLVPVLGAVERAAVSLLQVGFTLLLGWNRWLVLVTIPAHSALNLRAVQLIKRRSVILMETIVVVVGAAALAVGLLAWHR